MNRFNLGLMYPRVVGLGLILLALAIIPVITTGSRLEILKDGFFVEHPIKSILIITGWILIVLIGLLPLTCMRILMISASHKEIAYGKSVLFFINIVKQYDLNDFQKAILSNGNKNFSTDGTFAFNAKDGYATKEFDVYLKHKIDKNKNLKIQNIGSSKKAEKIYNQLKSRVE